MDQVDSMPELLLLQCNNASPSFSDIWRPAVFGSLMLRRRIITTRIQISSPFPASTRLSLFQRPFPHRRTLEACKETALSLEKCKAGLKQQDFPTSRENLIFVATIIFFRCSSISYSVSSVRLKENELRQRRPGSCNLVNRQNILLWSNPSAGRKCLEIEFFWFQSDFLKSILKDKLSRLSASHMHAVLFSGNKSAETCQSMSLQPMRTILSYHLLDLQHCLSYK